MYYISPPLHSVKCYNVTKHFPHFSIGQFERPSLTGDFQEKKKKDQHAFCVGRIEVGAAQCPPGKTSLHLGLRSVYIFKDMTLGIFDSAVEQNSCLWESLEFLKN